jgi:hypothetical protein
MCKQHRDAEIVVALAILLLFLVAVIRGPVWIKVRIIGIVSFTLRVADIINMGLVTLG